eukprot:TRINITY_DN2988_c0_g1_i1.p1 TRINITY_DN2988_c0_g1~~TRINITY_DN2988_c0_g1_i1.p1  ORF type:complete len:932 (-),score=453.78 TRINITY_DN2988_c0_g1_i1:233-3028(-)
MSRDGKYFTTTKKGEMHELKEELNSFKEDRQREAVKKVIAAMTVGKDVSMLFADVVKCMHTQDLELKKLVYLYIMNYAKSQPELAILAVNIFVKDAASPNPLLRALAIRTMGCIRVDKITEYLCLPLKKCLKDTDPYVRKTAAVCVAKLYDINPELVTDQGFINTLLDLLSDSNPMVVANAVAALSEIEDSSRAGIFKINTQSLSKLLNALNECTEWGQVFILNSLSGYNPKDSREAEAICERVTPRLQHANSAVVLGAVRVIMKYLDIIQYPDNVRNLCKKMAPPLVTLLSKEPEVQYVALRNLNLIVQKRPIILQNDIRVFFCKYNDPIYVKMEKLEIMIMLAAERNIDQVLLELKEYATEVDVEFVRKSVRSIGRCAIKLERAADKCVSVLLELIQTKVNYVVQEAIIVIKDIFRKYPNKYESIIATLCENLDTLDEPEAKAAMIWILGEYAERIENADELIEAFLESFIDENIQVQLQLLTATVKLFLKRPQNTQVTVQKTLKLATENCENPDLRDRAFIYWRLLSSNPEAAKSVVLSEKPLVNDDSTQLEVNLREELLDNLSTLASVFHKPPETFLSKYKRLKVKTFKPQVTQAIPEEEQDLTGSQPITSQIPTSPDLLDLSNLTGAPSTPIRSSDINQSIVTPVVKQTNNIIDLSDLLTPAPVTSQAPVPTPKTVNATPHVMQPSRLNDPLTTLQKKLLLPSDRGQGMQINGAFFRNQNELLIDLQVVNQSSTVLSGFMIQLNKNGFGFVPSNVVMDIGAIAPGSSANCVVPFSMGGQINGAPSNILQIAVKNNAGVFYFADALSPGLLLLDDGRVEKGAYLHLWKSIPDQNEKIKDIAVAANIDINGLIKRLEDNKLFLIARRRVADSAGIERDVLYISAKLINNAVVLFELAISSQGQIRCSTRSQLTEAASFIEQSIEMLTR